MTADRDRIEELLGDALGHTGRLQFDGDRYIVADALLPTVQALIADAEQRGRAQGWANRSALAAEEVADAEKRAAARALRELADDPAASTVTHTASFGLPARVVPVGTIYARAAALDPAGADSGEGR